MPRKTSQMGLKTERERAIIPYVGMRPELEKGCRNS